MYLPPARLPVLLPFDCPILLCVIFLLLALAPPQTKKTFRWIKNSALLSAANFDPVPFRRELGKEREANAAMRHEENNRKKTQFEIG